VGFNFRLTELSAAVGLAQLQRIDEHVDRREAVARALSDGVRDLDGLTPPHVRSGCRHVYYVWALRFDEAAAGVTRDRFSAALGAEGFPHAAGYVRPLYLLPLFQSRRAFGSRGYPFDLTTVQYAPGLCPVAERLHDRELLCFEPCAYDVDAPRARLLVEAIRKVHAHRHALAPTPPRSPEPRAHASHHCQH
jgi:dTDP-4-amino-4,6-dideoxygalactose transaminase